MNDQVPCLPRISGIPGPRGPAGGSGTSGANGVNGLTPTTTTTSPFTMPAGGAEVTVTVGNTSWMAIGMPLFVEAAGNFVVVTVISATTVRLSVQASAAGNAAAGTLIATGKKVVTGAVMTPDSTVTDLLTTRITALESTTQGNRSWYSITPPPNTGDQLRIGDIWFDTDDGNKIYRWSGTAWVDVQRVVQLADFGTGIRPIVKVTTLPLTGSVGDFVLLTTDNKLYRWTGAAWSKAVASGDLVGQIDGTTMIVDGTIIAQKLGANSVTADKVGANQIITSTANIGTAVITDAHISAVSAGKITAGSIQAVNIGHNGYLFHPTYPTKFFRATNFGTSFADAKNFGTGTAYTFSHCTPVICYGPGNAAFGTTGCPSFCTDPDNTLRVQVQGRLIGYYGNILIYCRINNGAYQPLASRYSRDGDDAVVDCVRSLTGVSLTSKVEFFVAPANGAGDATAGVTCRYEIDVMVFNW